MKNADDKKFNKVPKRYVDICQFVVMAVLFLFVLNNELVIFVKDFISMLPIGGGFVESVAIKGYFVFKVLMSSPSLFLFTIVFLQLVICAQAIKVWLIIYVKPFAYDKSDVIVSEDYIDVTQKYSVDSASVDMRLLL